MKTNLKMNMRKILLCYSPALGEKTLADKATHKCPHTNTLTNDVVIVHGFELVSPEVG